MGCSRCVYTQILPPGSVIASSAADVEQLVPMVLPCKRNRAPTTPKSNKSQRQTEVCDNATI